MLLKSSHHEYHKYLQLVLKSDVDVRTVAERFVRRSAASAKGNAIASLVPRAVLRLEENIAAHPERAATGFGWIFNDPDRAGKIWFDEFAFEFIAQH